MEQHTITSPSKPNEVHQDAHSALSTLPLEERISRLESEMQELAAVSVRNDQVTLLIFSGELDKVLAGLMIATTAASLGMNVTVFFTFWGINVLKEKRLYKGKDLMEKMIDLMTPIGAGHMKISQMNMLGAGSAMLKRMMKHKEIVTVGELLDIAKESGVKIIACSMTMQVMGIRLEELGEGIEVAGATSYLLDASRSGCTLFI